MSSFKKGAEVTTFYKLANGHYTFAMDKGFKSKIRMRKQEDICFSNEREDFLFLIDLQPEFPEDELCITYTLAVHVVQGKYESSHFTIFNHY